MHVCLLSGDCAIIVDPNNCFQCYKLCNITFLQCQYFPRDPNVSYNGCMLNIEGLDPSLLEQSSVDQNTHPDDDSNSNQFDCQWNHFGLETIQEDVANNESDLATQQPQQ